MTFKLLALTCHALSRKHIEGKRNTPKLASVGDKDWLAATNR